MDISSEIPVLSYTQQLPVLEEAYGEIDYYELVHVIPVPVWAKIKEQIGGVEDDSYIRILAKEGVALEELNALAEKVEDIQGGKYEIVVENRIQDKINKDAMINGMMLILGGFCVLLAVIGIGNVFSNTLGFVRREGGSSGACHTDTAIYSGDFYLCRVGVLSRRKKSVEERSDRRPAG